MARRAARGQLRRRRPKREPYDRVLIACVGGRTEPQYFQELANVHGLSTANVVVVPSHLDPMGLFKLAKKLKRQEQKIGEDCDRVFCVFDHDDQENFDSASQAVKEAGFRLTRSWPCFGFWFLLHFEYTRRPFERTEGRSKCDNCISALKRHLPHYAKQEPGKFRELEERLEGAIHRAAQALTDARKTEEHNPCTEVHELVRYLQTIKGWQVSTGPGRSRDTAAIGGPSSRQTAGRNTLLNRSATMRRSSSGSFTRTASPACALAAADSRDNQKASAA